MNTTEEWRDVPDYEGLYQVSSLGRVYSVPRVVAGGRGPTRVGGYLLTSGPKVCMCKNGVKRICRKAYLVAVAFLGIPCPGYVAIHKNGDQEDSRLENVAWQSVEDFRTVCGVADKLEIMRRYRGGESPASIRRTYPHISRETIWKIGQKPPAMHWRR